MPPSFLNKSTILQFSYHKISMKECIKHCTKPDPNTVIISEPARLQKRIQFNKQTSLLISLHICTRFQHVHFGIESI